MTKDDEAFHFLFNPRSVAVVGASENPLKMGHQCLLSLRESGSHRSIYPIHPRLKEILGIPAYPGLQYVPGEVDLAILAVPASETIFALKACQEKGVRGAIIITAGFREIEKPSGELLQKEMARIANQGRIKIIGPNTFGLVNVHAQLNASFTPVFSRLKPGSISVIGQSGGVSHLVAYQALNEGVGLSKVVGIGNRCNVDFADLLPFLEKDSETKCVILFIEGQDDPRGLITAVKKFASRKPIIAMKAGRYAESSKAARSHTGSLAGRYEIYEASLKQAGALVVQDPGELLDVAKILTMLRPPPGRNVAVMSFQAGPGILLTDAVVEHGLRMAVFSPATQEKLDKLLPPLTIRTNPVDIAFAQDEPVFEESLHIILQDENVDTLVIFLLHHPFMDLRRIVRPLLRQRMLSPKPILLGVNALQGSIAEEVAELERRGIPVYPLPDRAIRALKRLMQYGGSLRKG
ncbi:MAG: CoA-binding protein [Deltaproteobacteria bacterium]|nr:CoA-binding protein [Deltaproteobacteria bacterium]